MNACMGIKQDKDICKVADLPTVDDVDDYDNDPRNAAIKPSLDPMRPSFFSIRSEWNERLWKLLETDSLHDTGFDSAGMKQAFFNRLVRLARTLRESHQRNDETEVQFEERQTGHIAEQRKGWQRAHTRRKTVCSILCVNRSVLTQNVCSYTVVVKQLLNGTGWTVMAILMNRGMFLITSYLPFHLLE